MIVDKGRRKMKACHCSSIKISLLAKNITVQLTEVPGSIVLNIYQCNHCGDVVAEIVEEE